MSVRQEDPYDNVTHVVAYQCNYPLEVEKLMYICTHRAVCVCVCDQ